MNPTRCTWITGGGSGIGLALAQQLAGQGRVVVITGRDARRLSQACQTINDTLSSARVHYKVLDVTSTQAVAECVDEIEENQGLIELAVLNAGDHFANGLDDFSVVPFRQLFDVNVFGVLNCFEALLPRFKARNAGHIAVTASVAGYQGLPMASAYGASKAAIIHACEALYFELRLTPIKLQVINPGFVKTPLTDKNTFEMPFLVEPEQAAKAIIKGLKTHQFEIAFPTPFVLILKTLKHLPYRWYFALVGRMTGFSSSGSKK
ncbi:hypothetical protein DN062_11530 [Nitrincola tibetensis]|uniref:Short-chain dehydrogenase n=1 Tax=Nitrincola tibetensis TaxID=2219697 RepID=A0A364NKM4_9GAMM|nr:SDR family NAD(P)-dependent oxidoreductase [Nitrincola tibetensis]RAU17633.1 hypothetical protein DN062_11530 [Nitrincola tibetensis]